MLTQARLREVLEYNPATGVFVWRGCRRADLHGSEAGTVNKGGYRIISVDRKRYYAQRLAWLWMTGAWPSKHVDHKDRNTTNNSWRNLREASRANNMQNVPARRTNKTGFKGVTFYQDRGKYHAQIKANGKSERLGFFDTPEDAHLAYVAAARRLHGEFFRCDSACFCQR